MDGLKVGVVIVNLMYGYIFCDFVIIVMKDEMV